MWIGYGAIILAGRTIGTGAVIAAGAVVTRNVTPYTVVAGVPAEVIKPRFAPNIARRIEALAWWDWEHDRLQAAQEDFRCLPPEASLEKYGNPCPGTPHHG